MNNKETINNISRIKSNYKILSKWLHLKIYNKHISEYFNRKGLNKIAIYGMGELGKRLYDDLLSSDGEKVSPNIDVRYFIDQSKSFGYNGLEVFSLQQELPTDIDVIVVSTTYAMEEIQNKLKEKINCPIVGLDVIIKELMPQKVIPFLVVSVGQACNFRCKGCGDLAPYSPEKHKRYDVKNIIQDFTLILNSVDYIERVQIQGGEPFLYSDLDVLLEFLRTQEKVREIAIATNGSIIPKDSLLQLIGKCKIEIRISDYRTVETKADILKKKCDELGIRAWYYTFTSGESKWFDKGVNVLRESNDDIVEKRFRDCNNNGCLTLERSTLSYCSRATNSHEIQNFERLENDICVIDDREQLGEDIMKYINNKHAMEACRYCYGTDSGKMIPAAEQI